MMICRNELTSINGVLRLQEPVDTLRTWESSLRDTRLSQPTSNAFGLQEWFAAVSQMLRLQYRIFQVRIAAFSCNPPGLGWIGSHCAEAK
jgi:hypothetical protein